MRMLHLLLRVPLVRSFIPTTRFLRNWHATTCHFKSRVRQQLRMRGPTLERLRESISVWAVAMTVNTILGRLRRVKPNRRSSTFVPALPPRARPPVKDIPSRFGIAIRRWRAQHNWDLPGLRAPSTTALSRLTRIRCKSSFPGPTPRSLAASSRSPLRATRALSGARIRHPPVAVHKLDLSCLHRRPIQTGRPMPTNLSPLMSC